MSTMTVEEALRVTEGFDGAAHLVDEYVAECVCVLRNELNRPHQRLLRATGIHVSDEAAQKVLDELEANE